MKAQKMVEIKYKDVEFQYRAVIYEKMQMNVLGLRNAITTSQYLRLKYQ